MDTECAMAVEDEGLWGDAGQLGRCMNSTIHNPGGGSVKVGPRAEEAQGEVRQ